LLLELNRAKSSQESSRFLMAHRATAKPAHTCDVAASPFVNLAARHPASRCASRCQPVRRGPMTTRGYSLGCLGPPGPSCIRASRTKGKPTSVPRARHQSHDASPYFDPLPAMTGSRQSANCETRLQLMQAVAMAINEQYWHRYGWHVL
jgi:hypothetical protein